MYSYYIYTAFMLVIVILCIRQRDIRKQNGLSGRIKCILDTNMKTKIYMLFVCVCLISMAVVLVYVFPENTINRNIRSITITSILMIAAYYDYKEFRIPNKLIIPGIVLWIGITLFEMATCKDVWLANLITEIIVSLAFLIVCVLCAVIVKNGIGMGFVSFCFYDCHIYCSNYNAHSSKKIKKRYVAIRSVHFDGNSTINIYFRILRRNYERI